MKNAILFLCFWVLSTTGFAQSPFEQAMLTGIDSLHAALENGAIAPAINTFERIALAEPTRWEPLYYAVYGTCLQGLRESDAQRKLALCERGQAHLDKALALAPQESELHVLQGFLLNVRLLSDPRSLAQALMPKIHAAYETAMQLNPANPRGFYMKGTMLQNTPSFFGGGKDKAIPLFEAALAKFDSFQPATAIAPKWGRKDCEKQLAACR